MEFPSWEGSKGWVVEANLCVYLYRRQFVNCLYEGADTQEAVS